MSSLHDDVDAGCRIDERQGQQAEGVDHCVCCRWGMKNI